MLTLTFESLGYHWHRDITDDIVKALREHHDGPQEGLVGVFAVGSTIGLTVMRYESGAVHDLIEALEDAAPISRPYRHGFTTGDPNGFSHVRSSLLGTSVLLPMRGGEPAMSRTHRVVLIDFDLKPAERTVLVGSGNVSGVDR